MSVTRPRALDLFCGAGGVSVGLERAGFDVTGVDIAPMPHYRGGTFVQADALTYPLDGFSLIWASPPCQRYIRSGVVDKSKAPDLVSPIRDRLLAQPSPWVIENVPGAPIRPDLMLCGSHFGLAVRRHRWFELSWPAPLSPATCNHSAPAAGVYGNLHGKAGAWLGMLPSTLETWSEAMGVDWMPARELSQAIPPAYAEWIGREALAMMEAAA